MSNYIHEECTDVSIEKGWVVKFAEWLKNNMDENEEETVLEVCAGKGILGDELRNRSVEIIITDSASYWTDGERSRTWGDCPDNISSVDKIEAVEAIKRAKVLGQNVKYLLIGWPPGDDETAYNAIQAFSDFFPEKKIIYIGTTTRRNNPKIATDSFYDHFIRLDDDDSYSNNGELKSFKETVSDNYKSTQDDEVQLGIFKHCGISDCICNSPNTISDAESSNYSGEEDNYFED